MNRGLLTLAASLIMVGGLASGCQTLTGRPAGRWGDDRAVTARVKARLASIDLTNVTRVHVDTYDGVVYLTGGVDSAEDKGRAEEIAMSVPAVALVVNNLHVVGGTDGPMGASPRTEVATSLRGEASAVPRLAGVDWTRDLPSRIVRVEVESDTPAWTRYAAFDERGRQVATVFAMSGGEIRERGITGVPARFSATRIDFYREEGGARYLMVIWHDDEDADRAAAR